MLANAVYPAAGRSADQVHQYQGAPARRGGLANGASASIQVGGQSVLSAATAGVIGSRYTLLDAGIVAGDADGERHGRAGGERRSHGRRRLHVAGVEQCDGPQTSLIVDDNRLPAGGSR